MHADSDVDVNCIEVSSIIDILHCMADIQRSLSISVKDRQAEAGMLQNLTADGGFLTCDFVMEHLVEKRLVVSCLQIKVKPIRRGCQADWNAAFV